MNLPVFTKRAYIALGLAVVVVGSSIGFGVWAVSDNKGTIVSVKDDYKDDTRPKILDLNGRYINFKYSSMYQSVKQDAGGISLENYFLTANTNYEKHLAVAVYSLRDTNLESFSPYNVRLVQPSLYKRSEAVVAGNSVITFAKSDNSEQTVFIAHGDKVTSLSFTTTGSYDDLTSEVSTILQTFSWKP
jgi:hypothetical protein